MPLLLQEGDVLQQEVEKREDGLTYYSWYVAVACPQNFQCVLPLPFQAATRVVNLAHLRLCLEVAHVCRELKPHKLVTATAVKNRLILMSITANPRQYRKSQDKLRHMWKSLEIVNPETVKPF